jgi:hypothetical protein
MRQLTLFPSRGNLGIEMQFDIREPAKWSGLIGTAHFIGRPLVRPNGLLEIESVEIPEQRARPIRGTPKAAEQRNMPRIGPEPFAARIARSARMDLGPAIRDVLPHANALVDQPLGNGFALSGRFVEIEVAGVEPIRDGFEVVFALTGMLALRYEPQAAMAAPAQPPPETPTR